MSLMEIISDAFTYPFSDITKFIIVGILAMLAGAANFLSPSGDSGLFVTVLAIIISIVFSVILSGYGLQVIRKGIQHSNEIPDIDPASNIIDGIKVIIIGIVYYIIPFIIGFLFGGFTALIGAGFNHVGAGIGIGTIVAIIIFIIFSILEIVAVARFADTGDMGAALNFGAVFEDASRIGFVKIVLFIIIALIVIVVLSIVLGLLGIIPFIGIIIAQILVGGFSTLFINKGIGLLYASA